MDKMHWISNQVNVKCDLLRFASYLLTFIVDHHLQLMKSRVFFILARMIIIYTHYILTQALYDGNIQPRMMLFHRQVIQSRHELSLCT